MNYKRSISVNKLIKGNDLEILGGHGGLKNKITIEEINRPGVELAGFLDFFDTKRVILIGSKEAAFAKLFKDSELYNRVDAMLKLKPPCVLFSVNVEVPEIFIEKGNEYNVPILKSMQRTNALNSRVYSFLHSELAPRQSIHGVLMDIYGIGTLIIGKSGIGKSETALELLKRGHILISDDRVDVYEAAPNVLIGSAPKILERYIEVRGIGIVDVVQMFGAGSYRENKKVRVIVVLEHWNKNKVYDRLGIETETTKIFNSEIPQITIPILPGRNNAILVESAVMNQKLRYLGYNAALDLTKAVARQAMGEGNEDEDDV